jgi:predicted amidohydrolase YtcJ
MARENALDRITALKLITGGGYDLIREKAKGKIKKGYFADLVILNKDYFTIDEQEIRDVVSKLTIVNGKVVYGDKDYAAFAPAALPVIPEWSPVKHFQGYQYQK